MTYLINLFVFLLLISGPAQAVPITRIYGTTPDANFLKGYVERIERWNTNQGHSFNKIWSPEEEKFFSLWKLLIKEWGYTFGKGQIYEHFQWQIPVRNGQLEKASFFIGLYPWPVSAHSQIATIAKKRGYTIPSTLLPFFHGFLWNLQDGSFEVHFIFTDKNLGELPASVRQFSQDKIEPTWLAARKWIVILSAQKHVREQQLVTAPTTVNWAIVGKALSFDVLSLQKTESTTGTAEWRMDLRSLSPTILNSVTKDLVESWGKEFFLNPDSLTFFDSNNYTLYYP